jgi:multidrug transporter EmrE-like cation transporter
VLWSVLLGAAGQIALKSGMSHANGVGLVGLLRAAFLTPAVLLGIFLYVVSLVFWLSVLHTQELSYVYPMIAFGYVLVSLLSWWLFHDHMSGLRLGGILLICIGVFFVARS